MSNPRPDTETVSLRQHDTGRTVLYLSDLSIFVREYGVFRLVQPAPGARINLWNRYGSKCSPIMSDLFACWRSLPLLKYGAEIQVSMWGGELSNSPLRPYRRWILGANIFKEYGAVRFIHWHGA